MNVRIAAQGPWDGSLALATLDRLEEGLVREARPFDAARARVPGARERLFGSFDSARTRRHAVWSIATFATERDDDVRRRAGILLERSLAHEAPDVREHAALALAHWPDELIQPDRIVGLLRDGAGAVCRAAAYAVTVRGYRLAGRDLVAAFDRGGDPALLAALRAAMIELRTWDAIAERIGRLTSDAERRKTLWTLFEGVRDEDAVHAVAQVASQRQVNFRIRREALEVLASFWQPSAEGAQPWPGNARIRRALERGLADEAPVVREQATAGLAQIDA